MRRIVSNFAVPVAALLTPLCHAETALQPGYEAVTRTVRYADLNLTESEAAVTLYKRIKSAAAEVCAAPVASGVIDPFARRLRCEREAIAHAVELVNAGKLTKVHMALTNQLQVAMARP